MLNADLASSAERAWRAWRTAIEARTPLQSQSELSFISIQASHYFIRTLSLVRKEQRPKASLLLELYGTRDTKVTHDALVAFLRSDCSDYSEQMRHGILKLTKERTEVEKLQVMNGDRECVVRDEWKLARHVLFTAMMDKYHGWRRLEEVIFGSVV